MTKTSIVIANYNNAHLIRSCIASINSYMDISLLEVVIVDNGSSNHELETLAIEYPFIQYYLLTKNRGFGYAINYGVKKSTFQNIVIMNSDIEVLDETFQELVNSFDALPGGQLWSPEIIGTDGKLQMVSIPKSSMYCFLQRFSMMNELLRLRNRQMINIVNNQAQSATVEILYGACLLVKKSDYVSLSGFDDKYFMYFEDIDFCDRFISNLSGQLSVHPESRVRHIARGSSESRRGINKIFLKSKYRYAMRRFGFAFGLLFLIVDLPYQIMLGYLLAAIERTRKLLG